MILVLRYPSAFALYDIANMDDFFSSVTWKRIIINSCSFRNDAHLVIFIIQKLIPLQNV